MTLRFGIAQLVVAIGLVASLGVPTFARDDDPRDFKNNNQNNNNQNNRDRDDDDDDNNRKVTICHRVDRDDDDDDDDRRGFSAKTITVSQNAVNAHLAHGDTLGPCPVSPSRPQKPHDRDKDSDRD